MNFRSLFTSSWFGCTALTLIIIVGLTAEAPVLQSLENSIYDRLSSFHEIEQTDKVVLIAIDQDSIGQIGSWPWPRSVVSKFVERLNKAGAKAIGIDLPFPNRETNDGIKEINRIKDSLTGKGLNLSENSRQQLRKNLSASEKRLNNDAKLIRSFKTAGNVIVPMQFFFGDKDWPQTTKNNGWIKTLSIDYPKETRSVSHSLFQLENPFKTSNSPIEAKSVSTPFKDLLKSSAGLGHSNFIPDRDGAVRSSNLFVSWENRLYPSMATRLSLDATDTKLADIRGVFSKNSISALNFANLTVPVGSDYRMLMASDGKKGYTSYPFHSVHERQVSKEDFENRIVILGLTAPGLTTVFKTSTVNGVSSSELTAAATASIMAGSHISRPGWTWALEMGALLYFGLILIFILPRVKISLGTLILTIFVFFWQTLSIILFVSQGIWIKSGSPTILAILGLALVIINRQFFNPLRTATDIEANKVLGLSFQSQGLLDLALEKFMKCPGKDPSVKDLLYNLALDMERKRMHNKAKAVYEHIYTFGPYKDIKEKIERLKLTAKMPSFSKPDSTTLSMTATDEKPTLGRYEILEELGQGAIGTVYLGRDPKINREVAIKTLRYDQVESGDLAEVKNRFFREAEAAGKLNHPNIVTIYDIDEDHDMTFMAMELLDGTDLSSYCKMGNLLSVAKVLEIIVKVAEALEYAHKNHVVHRDIKPANIILLKDGHVKVADFGIARLLTSSNTQTGVILGTPNYMSPEQVAGKKVDGRSDQFSLGVVLYELLTGIKPFQNPNIAVLMHSISTVSYTPLQEIDPGLPECCINLATKLMSKAKSRRFDKVGDIVSEAKKCLREFSRT